jgi:uncharacterized protein
MYKEIRWDEWTNYQIGYGTSRDKTTYTEFSPGFVLADEVLDNLYNEGGIVTRICEAFPKQYFKKDFKLKISKNGKIDNTLSDEIKKDLNNLNLKEKYTDCFVWANVFGNSVLFLVCDDGEDLSQPLNIQKVNNILNMNILDKRDLSPLSFYEDPSHEKYGRIETFILNSPIGTTTSLIIPTDLVNGQIIHESRCIFFDGQRTSNYRKRFLNGWNTPFLQQIYNVVKSYGIGFKTLDLLITDANVGVLKFKGYYDYIANKEFSAIQSRLQAMDIQKSVSRSLVVDADTEDYKRQDFRWLGIVEAFQLLMLNLSAQTGIPVTILMGREPAGENATGEADFKSFYDNAESDQKNKVTPKIIELVKYLCIIKKVNIKEIDIDIDIEYEDLNELSLETKAKIRKLVSESDKLDIESGIITPEEINKSRYTDDGWKFETYPDKKMRSRLYEE